MKILIVTYFFPPMNAIGGQRPYAWAKTWAALGHEVDVLTIPKDAPFNEASGFKVHEVPPWGLFVWIRHFYRRFLKSKSGTGAKKVGPSAGPRPGLLAKLRARGLGTSTRMPDASDLWIAPALTYAKGMGKEWDCVVSTYGPYSGHVIGWRIKQAGLAKTWAADYRDLWTLNPYFVGFPGVRSLERSLERLLMKSADMILTVSGPLAEKMRALHSGTPVHTIENGANPEEFQAIPKEPKPPSSKKRILFTGTLYDGRQDPTPLLRALRRLDSDQIEVVFAGPSSEVVRRYAQRSGAEAWVRDLGLVPRSEALSLQVQADVLLFVESSAPDSAGVLTGKLFEYLFSGTEVWGVGVDMTTLSGQIIQNSGAGETFGSDEDRLYQALLRLQREGSRPTHLKDEYRRKFDRREQAKRVLELLTEAGR